MRRVAFFPLLSLFLITLLSACSGGSESIGGRGGTAPVAKTADSHIISFMLPQDIKKEDILYADEVLKDRLHKMVLKKLESQVKLPESKEDGHIDYIIVFTDQSGNPILPDLENERSRIRVRAPLPLAANELSFSFNSPSYPWSSEELGILNTALSKFYPIAKTIYGNPAFNINVNIRKDPNSYANMYYSSINEIVLINVTLDQIGPVCHEMIHAFRDDDIIYLNSFEEGMARATEVEVLNRLQEYYHDNRNHSYTYDVFYEALNKNTIGSKYGNFNHGYSAPTLLRYQLSGYAWAKLFLEDSNFLINFNNELYKRIISDPSTNYTESKLLTIAETVMPSVEGEPFLAWYNKQGALNTNPPYGYIIYQRINQFGFDFFYRDTYGNETQQTNTIDWSVYDYKDELLDSGTVIPPSYSISPYLPIGYSGRIKIVASASTPDGIITDTSFRTAEGGLWGDELGVFGVVSDSTSGTLTLTSLDSSDTPIIVSVTNGGFSGPSLKNIKGRIHAFFVDSSGAVVSRTFTKDASNYFLFLEAGATTPSPPANLSAAAVSSSQINLIWTDQSTNETGFQIERKTGAGGTYAQIGTAAANATAYSDTGRTEGTTYYYRVRAVNGAGNSAYSNEANATTSVSLPAAPANLSAAAASVSQINLIWTDQSTNETGFQIERKTGAGGTYAQIGTAAANATAYSDTGRTEGTTYYYRVRAVNGAGNSTYSNEANATTAVSPPVSPANLSAAAVSSSQINLTWTDQSDNEDGFRVYRGTDSSTVTTLMATLGVGITSYSNTDLAASTTYYYKVTTFNIAGESAASNVANATTEPPPVTIPSAPTNLQATAASSSVINLTWNDASANETGFQIERKTGAGGTYAQISDDSRKHHDIQRQRACGRGDVLLSNTGGQRSREHRVLQRGECDHAILRNRWRRGWRGWRGGCSISPEGKLKGESPLGTMLALFSPGIFLVVRKTINRKQNIS